jgi:hypothetical protein
MVTFDAKEVIIKWLTAADEDGTSIVGVTIDEEGVLDLYVCPDKHVYKRSLKVLNILDVFER